MERNRTGTLILVVRNCVWFLELVHDFHVFIKKAENKNLDACI